jgi:hypothetical protein
MLILMGSDKINPDLQVAPTSPCSEAILKANDYGSQASRFKILKSNCSFFEAPEIEDL